MVMCAVNAWALGLAWDTPFSPCAPLLWNGSLALSWGARWWAARLCISLCCHDGCALAECTARLPHGPLVHHHRGGGSSRFPHLTDEQPRLRSLNLPPGSFC